MTRLTNQRIARFLLIGASVVLVAEAILFAYTMVSVLNGFERQSEERRAATAELLEDQERRTRELQKDLAEEAEHERAEIRRGIREVLRQLGLDPSRIPPPSEDEPQRESEPQDPPERQPEPRPSRSPSPKPSPSPSRTCLARVGPICVEDP